MQPRLLKRSLRPVRPGILRRSMPQGIYGRAALILILPVITLQLVVSIVFIQRHFEDVTAQMTRNVLIETRYLLGRVNDAPDLAAAREVAATVGPELGLRVGLPAELDHAERRLFYDLPGRVVIETLRARLPALAGVDLASDNRAVHIFLETAHGGMEVRLPRSRVSASNPHQLLVWMIFTGLLMTLISIVFLRNQLRPIRRLARAAEAFGKGRHEPYTPAGAREVRSAGQAFVDMRDRIERQIEQRTLMLSGISHDLRTPLTRLRLSLSLAAPNEDTAAMLRDVEDMQRLVDEFLSFARGDALDDAVPTDLTALVRRVIADVERGTSGRIAFDVAEETGPLVLRPRAVGRAIENLLSNAVRYGRSASVRLERIDGVARIRVEDDGPGIPDERLADAVKPFARLDPARNQNDTTGVGLGLAIARRVAEMTAHLYAARSYLDARGRPRSPAETSGHDFVSIGDPDTMIGHLQPLGLPVTRANVRLGSANGLVAWEYVRRGFGIAPMADTVAAAAPEVERVLPEMAPVAFPVWLVTHRELQTSRRIRLVYDLLAEAFAGAA